MPEESTGEAVRRVARLLAGAGIDTPERDARLLVAAALGASPGELILRPERVLAAAEADQLKHLADRRGQREPVSRILGAREFYGRPFVISAATLDPRPCSETLISAVLDLVDETGDRERPLRLIDIGTGSGCLIVTLLAELTNATGLATDVDAEALVIARRNAHLLLGAEDRVAFAQRRSLVGIEGPFDILISNPPYVATAEIGGLEPEVKDFDPTVALDGGADGLTVYRELAKDVGRVVPCGWVMVEVGAGQARDVEQILRAGLSDGELAHVRTWTDLGGHTRCVAIETHL